MHILVIPSWYPNNDLDISGSFFKEQAEAIKDLGHEVTIAYVETRSIKKVLSDLVHGHWKPGFELKEDGLKEYRWRVYNWLLKIPYGKESLVERKLKKILNKIQNKENPVDLIHLHSFLSHGYGVEKIFRNTEIPLVLTEHYSGFPRGALRSYQKNIVNKLLKRVNKIIVVGPGLKESLSCYTDKPVEIIPNMVDISLYQNSDNRQRGEDKYRFLSIGNLNYNKGLDLQIQAASLLKNDNIPFELIIVGDGAYRGELVKLIHELKLENNVKLYGKVLHDQIPAIIKDCDTFVLSSRNETFGVVLIEAMAAGKPVITTNNAGPFSIVTKETGLVVENENINEIYNAMKFMVGNENHFNSDDIKSYCKNNFSKESIINQIVNVYKEMLY